MKDKILKNLKILFRTGFFHIFGSNVINKIIGFLSSIILVRLLTKAEYGIFTYSWNIYSILILANGLGMESAVLQICSEKTGDDEFCKKATSYGAKIGFGFNCLLCVGLAVIGFFIPLAYNGANTLIKLLCFLPLCQLLYNLTCIVLRYQRKNSEYSKLTIINTSLLLIGSVVGALLFKEKGLILGYYIAYISSAFVGNRVYGVHLEIKSNGLMKQVQKDLISIGLVSMINNGISELLYLLDVFILGIVASNEAVLASYKVATIIPTAMAFIPLSLMTYTYPYFAEHKDDKSWCLSNYKKILFGFGGFNLVISSILFLGANIFVEILFGSQYIDAVPVFRLLAINYFISGTFRIISGNLLVTQRKLKFNTIVAVLSGIVNVIADYFFIQFWGSIGAALATVLVVAFSSIMNTTYLIYTFRNIGNDTKR